MTKNPYMIELEVEQIDKIVADQLVESLEYFREALEQVQEGKNTQIFDFHNLDEEREQLEEHLKAFQLVARWFGYAG